MRLDGVCSTVQFEIRLGSVSVVEKNKAETCSLRAIWAPFSTLSVFVLNESKFTFLLKQKSSVFFFQLIPDANW